MMLWGIGGLDRCLGQQKKWLGQHCKNKVNIHLPPRAIWECPCQDKGEPKFNHKWNTTSEPSFANLGSVAEHNNDKMTRMMMMMMMNDDDGGY